MQLLDKTLTWVRRRPLLRNGIIMVVDVAIAAAAFSGAYLTVYARYPDFFAPAVADKTLGFSLAALLSFVIVGQYRGSWRYVSIPDLKTLIKASLATVAIYTVVAFIATRGANVPRSIPILSLIYLIGGLATARVGYRILMEQFVWSPRALRTGRRGDVNHVLLCGFSDQAESLIRANRREDRPNFVIVGIVDDAKLNHGRVVQGIKVLGGLDDLGAIMRKLSARGTFPRELIVTEPSPSRKRLAHILEQANQHDLKVARLPSFGETSTITADALVNAKPIEISDLLERPEIETDLASVAAMIENKVVLITGAGGSIGSELSRQIAEFKPQRLVAVDISEFNIYALENALREANPDLDIMPLILDIRDKERVQAIFAEYRPHAVFHAAALKHVALVESNSLEAVKTNLLGTRNVADAALSNHASTFVMISTDKAVNPTSVMGATKRAAEAYCQSLDVRSEHTRFKTVRFGNVLGSKGSVVPRFEQQIASGGPLMVTHPQVVRFFMTVAEAVRLVLHASAHELHHRSERGTIMVLDMGKPVRIVDLAERMIQLAGFKPYVDIAIEFSGLRAGEKLYEELFDPDELRDRRIEDGYMIALPRIVDRLLLERTLAQIEAAAQHEEEERAMQFLAHMVPEYQKTAIENLDPPKAIDNLELASKLQDIGLHKPV